MRTLDFLGTHSLMRTHSNPKYASWKMKKKKTANTRYTFLNAYVEFPRCAFFCAHALSFSYANALKMYGMHCGKEVACIWDVYIYICVYVYIHMYIYIAHFHFLHFLMRTLSKCTVCVAEKK